MGYKRPYTNHPISYYILLEVIIMGFKRYNFIEERDRIREQKRDEAVESNEICDCACCRRKGQRRHNICHDWDFWN